MLEIINVTKKFVKGPAVVDGLNLTIHEGEFFSLLGPSGCGKTTLLRMIAGLESLSSGEIRLDGKRVDTLPAQDRPFNMVFQRYALFPHLNVGDNIAFGLRLKKFAKAEIQSRVQEALDLVGLEKLADRLPETLSGGQAQRVAIARALVNRPRVLLLDEPLSALDQKLREHMQTELKLLQRKLGLTFVYVTHDQEEALALSDRIGVMNQGRLEQVSEPKDLYDEPSTLFAAQFVGPMTSIETEFVSMDGNLATIRFGDTLLKARPKENFQASSERTLALVRPERLKLLPDLQTKKDLNVLAGRVSHTVFRGTQMEVVVEVAQGISVKAYLNPQEEFVASIKVGAEVQLAFEPKDTFLFLGQS